VIVYCGRIRQTEHAEVRLDAPLDPAIPFRLGGIRSENTIYLFKIPSTPIHARISQFLFKTNRFDQVRHHRQPMSGGVASWKRCTACPSTENKNVRALKLNLV